MVRNTAEAIGVFSHIDTANSTALKSYKSSVRVSNLIGMERQLALLKSPRWPSSVLGELDPKKIQRGKKLFLDHGCNSCHKNLEWNELQDPANEQMIPVLSNKVGEEPLGTDVALVCNTLLQKSNAGNFLGQRVFVFSGSEKIQSKDYTRNMLVNSAIGSIWGQFGDFFGAIFRETSPQPEPKEGAFDFSVVYLPDAEDKMKSRVANCLQRPANDLLRYKSRPLNGIWATAPYLHNGSVPTLYDLLLPSRLRMTTKETLKKTKDYKFRPESFFVGTREFDEIKVGFKTSNPKFDKSALGNNFEFRVRNKKTKEPIFGNYNSGHNYGTESLSHQDRLDLVEYLKSL